MWLNNWVPLYSVLIFWKPKVYEADGSDFSACIPLNMFGGEHVPIHIHRLYLGCLCEGSPAQGIKQMSQTFRK
jgi:hypothetical protein